MNWKTATHVLKFPIAIGDKTIAAITLREPDLEALEIIDDLGIEAGKAVKVRHLRGLIEALGDAPSEAVGKLHCSDLAALGELLAPLLETEAEGAS